MRAKRVDTNHKQIVEELRKFGVSVQSLASVGDGCPDIICGKKGTNWIFEIKDPSKPPSKRRKTSDQQRWHDMWRGQVNIIHSSMEAMEIINL